MQKTPAGATLPKPTETTKRDASQFARMTSPTYAPARNTYRFTRSDDTGPRCELVSARRRRRLHPETGDQGGPNSSVTLRCDQAGEGSRHGEGGEHALPVVAAVIAPVADQDIPSRTQGEAQSVTGQLACPCRGCGDQGTGR